MKEKFVQKRLTHRLEVSFDYDGVFVDDKRLLTESRYKIYYDQMEPDPMEEKVMSKMWLVISIISILGLCLTSYDYIAGAIKDFNNVLICILAVAISVPAFFMRISRYFIIPAGDNPLVLYKDNPGKEAFNAFVEELYERRLEYIEEMEYEEFDESVDLEALDNLNYLKSMNAITDEEYEQRRREIIRRRKSRDESDDFSLN
jgi:hypothetical protein